MSLNIDQLKSKLHTLQNTQTRKDSIWKPSGKHTIRIVPYKFNPENPFIELYFHYAIKGKTYMSPTSFGEKDPFVEFAKKLKATGSTEDWKESRRFEPKLRTYLPVIERGKENEGVKFYGFGKTVYEELLGYISDPDYGDITDPKTGRDISIEYLPAEKEGTFAKTQLRVKPNPTPLTTSKEIYMKLMNEQKEITEIYDVLSYSDLEGVLKDYLGLTSTDSSTSPDDTNEPVIEKSKNMDWLTDGDTQSPTETDESVDSNSSDMKVSEVEKQFDDIWDDK